MAQKFTVENPPMGWDVGKYVVHEGLHCKVSEINFDFRENGKGFTAILRSIDRLNVGANKLAVSG